MANTRLTKNVLQLISKLLNNNENDQRGRFPLVIDQKEPTPLVTKSLITEKDIMRLNANQKILAVDKGTIITPLAKDRAKAMGIKIEKRGGA